MGVNTSTNMHLPFNPIIGQFNPPEVEYTTVEETWFCDEENSIAYSGENEPKETTQEAIYRGPIFMLNGLFNHTSVDTAWSGSSKTMTGDFTSDSHITTMVVQNHVQDQDGSSHVDTVYYGVKLTEHYLDVKKGRVMTEGWSWKARGTNTTAQACDMVNGYDGGEFNRTGVDGGFDNWDASHVNGIHASTVTLTAAGAAISHVNVENFRMGCKCPKEYLFNQTTKDAFDVSNKPREYYLEVEGTISGKNKYTEIRSTIANRTRRTYKMLFKTNNYLQFTNGILERIDPATIPKAGEPLRVKMRFKGVAGTSGTNPTMSFYGLFSNAATDPDDAVYDG
jgi:hypothetical protein